MVADVMVRWRNNASKEFEKERRQEVSKELDYLFFQCRGIYQTRQYEISFTDSLPFAVLNLEEEVSILER